MSEGNAEKVLRPAALGKRKSVLEEESLEQKSERTEPPKKAKPEILQGKWNELANTGNWGKNDITAGERKSVEDAVAAAEAAVKEHAGQKKIHVHLGIGVGNPGAAFGEVKNNSPEMRVELARAQVNPPYLDALQLDGVYVVALNFNVPDPDAALRAYDPSSGIHLQVPVPFPLFSGGESGAAVKSLQGLTRKRQVAVVNCIEGKPYQHMVGLVPTGGYYISSYIEDPAEVNLRIGSNRMSARVNMASPELLITYEP